MNKVTPTQFGEKLRDLREHKGFSIRQAALQSKSGNIPGVSPSYWSLIERGERSIPRAETMRKLAKGLRVEQNEIFSFAGFKDVNLMPQNITEPKHVDIVRIPVLEASDLLREDEDLQAQSYELVDSNTIDLNFSYYWISVTQTDLLADHIMPGDLTLIKETDIFYNDQICLVRTKHDRLILAHVSREGSTILLVNYESGIKTRVFSQQDSHFVKIIGTVQQIRRNFA